MGTLTDRLILHASIDQESQARRTAHLRLALRRQPTESDWDTCAAIRRAHALGDAAEVARLTTALTKEG